LASDMGHLLDFFDETFCAKSSVGDYLHPAGVRTNAALGIVFIRIALALETIAESYGKEKLGE